MTHPDYQARAELYLGSDRNNAAAQGPRSFRTAAQALRFALEEAAPVSLHFATLHIGAAVFSGAELTWLYRSPDYPLPRRPQGNSRPGLLRCPFDNEEEPTMEKFNYQAMAELYPSRRYAKSQRTQYRRFDNAAEAIRCVIEDMPAKGLAGSFLEVNERRFEGDAIRALYDAAEYPLERLKIAA